jgi:hypothetical protein
MWGPPCRGIYGRTPLGGDLGEGILKVTCPAEDSSRTFDDTSNMVRRLSVPMNKEGLSKVDENFREFVYPLLDEDDEQDFHLVWEFEKYIHAKKLQMMTAEKVRLEKWKQAISGR